MTQRHSLGSVTGTELTVAVSCTALPAVDDDELSEYEYERGCVGCVGGVGECGGAAEGATPPLP